MVEIVYSLVFVAIESWFTLYFLDTFLIQRSSCKFRKYRFFFYWGLMYITGSMGNFIGWFKIALLFLLGTWIGRFFYKASFKNNLCFLMLSYGLILLIDWIVLSIEQLFLKSPTILVGEMDYLLALSAKLLSVLFVLIIRRVYKKFNNYADISTKEWCLLISIPVFCIATVMIMLAFYPDEAVLQGVFLFLAIGLIGINFVVIYLVQDILEKGETIKVNTLLAQKTQNQLQSYQEMENMYESQRRKLHDYKNQLIAIQNLLKKEQVEEAIIFTEKLTDSIAISMSVINTNHPVVNAVLNHKLHIAQEKNIPIICKLGDVHEVLLEEEEIVILLSNLLDNAIHECEKLIGAGKEAIIHLKLVYEDAMLILSVKNPVFQKEEIVDNEVCVKQTQDHGIGLLNVKQVVEKHHGDMVLCCDDKEFKVVIMIDVSCHEMV